MQWSHHARPRDTHFPTCWKISSRTQDGWIKMHTDLEDVLATGAEKARHAAGHAHDLGILGLLPWSEIEELAAFAQSDATKESRSYLLSIMMVVAVLSFALPLSRGTAFLPGVQAGENTGTHTV